MSDATSRPRHRPIGPFFVIALVMSAGVFIWQRHQTAQRLANLPPPVIEHRVIGGADDKDEVVPRPDLVLDYADDLTLSAEQRRKLEPLIARYREEAAPLREQLAAAQDRWDRELRSGAQGKPRASGQQIAEQMTSDSELSGRLTRLRQSYWPEVAKVLTARQQDRARLLWVSELRGQPLH